VIPDGSHHFKKRFIAISRAGNRMITMDQTLQMDYTNQKRAELRSHLSANLLLSLANARIAPAEEAVTGMNDEALLQRRMDSTNQSTVDDSQALLTTTSMRGHCMIQEDSAGSTSIQENATDTALPSLPQHMNQTVRFHYPGSLRYQSEGVRDDSMDDSQSAVSVYSSLSADREAGSSSIHSSDLASISSSSSSTSPSKRPPPPSHAEKELTATHRAVEESPGNPVTTPVAYQSLSQAAVEIDLTLSRSLTYQIGSQGYVLNRVHVGNEDRDRLYLDAETELAREVTVCIEEREKALLELQMEAAILRKAYLEAPLLTSASLSGRRSRSRPPTHSSSNSNSRPSSHKSPLRPTSHKSLSISIDDDDGDDHEEHRVVSDIERLEPLLVKMNTLRRATMEFADAFGAWA